jgi:hypothetical protein
MDNNVPFELLPSHSLMILDIVRKWQEVLLELSLLHLQCPCTRKDSAPCGRAKAVASPKNRAIVE